jgi:hypothetical protein
MILRHGFAPFKKPDVPGGFAAKQSSPKGRQRRQTMNGTVLASFILLFGSSTLSAQTGSKIVAEGGTPDEAASTRLAYFAGESGVGQFAINYGRPVWRAEYDDTGKFDQLTKGKVWRMGSNFWTSLYTDLPLTISGKAVAPGFYFLGLERSADGSSWRLAFIDPVKVRNAHTDAYNIQAAHVEFTVPMNLEPRAEPAQKLTVTLAHNEGDLQNATLQVAWGRLGLTAPVKVTLGR